MRSVMCVPILRAGADVLGVVQLDAQESGNAFSQRDLGVLAGLAAETHAMLDRILPPGWSKGMQRVFAKP